MNSILIIEDHEDVNLMLAEALSDAGYEVKSLYNGAEGVEEIREGTYDLVILDIMLPFKNGDVLLKELREFSNVPVIVISAKGLIGTKIELLKLGADDYMTKPFDLGEVEARVESNLRRFGIRHKEQHNIRYKDLLLNDSTQSVTVNQASLELTAKEYRILELLMKHDGKVFTKSNLYESVWQDEYVGDDNAVKTHISNLRNKLRQANPQEDYIETVWGLGYRLSSK